MKAALAEAKKAYAKGEIPVGAWVFNLRFDGGEKDRGYNDSEGNAYHVGIYVGNNQFIHAPRPGKNVCYEKFYPLFSSFLRIVKVLVNLVPFSFSIIYI